MQSGPEIIRQFQERHGISWSEFLEWARDNEIPEAELNHHDSRALAHLEAYRDEHQAA